MEYKWKYREKEYHKDYREQNREKNNEYSKNYYKNNKGKWVGYRERDSFPCVYIFLNSETEIIRIGSCSYLKGRILNYFNEAVYKGWGLYKWFNTIDLDRIVYLEIDTREKAYALESVLIDKYKPILNVNDVNNTYWDKFKESLGDLTDIEELFIDYDIEYYKEKYKHKDL